MLSRRAFLALAAGAPLLPLACSPHPDLTTIQGSGATFPAPLYKRWFLEMYRNGIVLDGDRRFSDPHRTRINYQPIGSGAGTRQFREGLTDFGASDDVKADKINKEGKPDGSGDLAQIHKKRGVEAVALPMTAGTIVLANNLPPLKKAGKVLLLTRENLIEILVGEISDWSHSRLTKLNPDLEGYHKKITWVRRSDGSGTTAAFTKHVGEANKGKKNKDGEDLWPKSLVGKAPDWPVSGIGAKGNDGVSATVGGTPGALGYVEYGYAKLGKLSFAALENHHGEFVQPKRVVDKKNPTEDGPDLPDATPDQIALNVDKVPDNLLISVADPKAENAYPIATYTWMLVPRESDSEKIARGLGAMLRWCLTKGQEISNDLDYVPLPAKIREKVLARVGELFPAST
jgi:phosphate transport system substrate-binding protein